ncbi:SagB family peptide dehydrogenase [Lactococcus lactis]|uniref:SagB family peptide dehydrogenase n=1 Tax=Lactococcus lactis TaxID=1358 RepID=UPI0022E88BBD|nr:SagB family peptide dehydrogenase [Lactococcus lactis]
MKKVKLDREIFYTPNFDYEKLKTRRKKFATNRINWFLNNSPKQEYTFPKENIDDFDTNLIYDYYQETEEKNDIRVLFEKRSSTLLNSFDAKWNSSELFELLTVSIGPNPKKRRYHGDDLILRNYPSGGALFPIKMYVLIKNVEGISPGVYYISPQLKKLIMLTSNENIQWDTLFPMTLYKLDALSNSTDTISFAIFMAVDFKETFKKYGELSERLAFFEAGHVTQNLQLISTYLKKNSLPICGFFPEEIEKLIGIQNNDDEYCIYGILFG